MGFRFFGFGLHVFLCVARKGLGVEGLSAENLRRFVRFGVSGACGIHRVSSVYGAFQLCSILRVHRVPDLGFCKG